MRVALISFLVFIAFLDNAARASAQTEKSADILFVLDSSASMSRDDWRGRASDPNDLRLTAVRAFVALATPRMRVGLINLSDVLSPGDGLDPPTALQTGLVAPLTDASPRGKGILLAAVTSMKTTHQAGLEDGFTYMTRALGLAGRVMVGSRADEKFVIVLTDGDVTGEDPRDWWRTAAGLKAQGLNVIVFRLGRRQPPGLTNADLTDLNGKLVPGGSAQVIDRPDDILGHYLQTFSQISADAFVNVGDTLPIGRDHPILHVTDWMDIQQIDILVPGKPGTVTRLYSERLGRDVLRDARVEELSDPNLEILTLSRERLGALSGNWRIDVANPTGEVQFVSRSRIAMFGEPLYQPKGAPATVAVVSVSDGSVPIPSKAVVARGPIGGQPSPMLAGALGPRRYSGVVIPDREGKIRVQVQGEGQSALPPRLEKTFLARSTDRISLDGVAERYERVGEVAPLKVGEALRVRLRVGDASNRCRVTAAAVRVGASYRATSPGMPEREADNVAQPLGDGGDATLMFGFVPHGPGNVLFALDHGVASCAELDAPIAILPKTGGAPTSFAVDVERLLKVSKSEIPGPTGLPVGTSGIEIPLRYDVSSWRNEKIMFSIQGMSGANVAAPTLDVAARDGGGRPRRKVDQFVVPVNFGSPRPGGDAGRFTLVAQGVEPDGSMRDLGRFDYSYDVAPGILGAIVSRSPLISRDGVAVIVAVNAARLGFIPPAVSQDFEVAVGGLSDGRAEPSAIRVLPGRDIAEHRLFVQTTEFCRRDGPFGFTLDLKPAQSANGDILVSGVPLRVNVPLPAMALRVSGPERIGALRRGTPFDVTVQSTSLCPETFRMTVTEPAQPDRFPDSGLESPNFVIQPGGGEVRSTTIVPSRATPRGSGGTLVLRTERLSGHPATVFPVEQEVAYYTPLWTEEYPRWAVAAFVGFSLLLTGILALPGALADPIVAHRLGDSSVVSGRKRRRWFVTSLTLSLIASYAIVYVAMARYLP